MEDTHKAHTPDVDRALMKRLKVSVALTGTIFLAELIGGYLSNSLALISDAVHVFMDVLALGLSLFAMYVAQLPPTEKRTFGLHRVEVFVSFLNSASLFLITLYIFYKAYGRFTEPQEVESMGMLVVAAVGLVVNVAVAVWLWRYAEQDLNIKSAFIHVLGDAAASVGVIIGAVVIRLTGWYTIDPAMSVLIGLIIIVGASRIIKESSEILLEGVPRDVDLTEVVSDIKSVDGVTNVHSLHIWSICHNIYALSAHVDLEPPQRRRMGEIFGEVNRKLAETHHIFYTTLQAECSGCNNEEVLRKISHKDLNHLH